MRHEKRTFISRQVRPRPQGLESLACREIFEMARSLHAEPAGLLPTALLQRLSTVNAQLVTSIAANAVSPAPAAECARALKRLRWERERAAIQREIDRLQELGAVFGAKNGWERADHFEPGSPWRRSGVPGVFSGE